LSTGLVAFSESFPFCLEDRVLSVSAIFMPKVKGLLENFVLISKLRARDSDFFKGVAEKWSAYAS
jgi:hypothetical protein